MLNRKIYFIFTSKMALKPISTANTVSLASIIANETNHSIKAKMSAWLEVNNHPGNSQNADYGALHSLAMYSSQKTAIENWHKSVI